MIDTRFRIILPAVGACLLGLPGSPALATLDFDGTPWVLEYDGVGLPTGGATNFDAISMNSSQYNPNDKFTGGDAFPGWLTANGNPGGMFGKNTYTGLTKSTGWTFEWKSVSNGGAQVTSNVHQINDNDSLLRIDYGANQITLRDGYPGSAGGGMTSTAALNLAGGAEHTFRLVRQAGSSTVELYVDGNFTTPAAQITPFSYAQGFNNVVADSGNLNSMHLGNSLYENAYDFVRLHGGSTPVATVPPPSTAAAWQVGRPITMYHEGAAGVTLTHAVAQQAVEGGFNVVWARTVAQLDIAQQYGLRAMWDGSLDADTIKAVSAHPATYSFNLSDEPPPNQFHQIGGRMKYMRTIAPGQTSLVTVLPTYVFPTDTANAYAAYLDDYVSTVQPSLLVYDHYNFYEWGDHSQYFMNLKLVSDKAREAGIPFMNTVQGSAWDTGWRVPNEHELRYLNYTSLAYDAQGMNYWAYNTPNPNSGGLAPVNGNPTSVFTALTTINREFESIGDQIQHLDHIGGFHIGNTPEGTQLLPGGSEFTLSGGTTDSLMGLFGRDGDLEDSIYALVVNLDYDSGKSTTISGPGDLSIYNPVTHLWTATNSDQVLLNLVPGGGVLVALTSEVPKVGDADRDGDVDLSDLAALATSYGNAQWMRWQNGDFDWDGDVDLSDLAALAGNYGLGSAQAFADFQAIQVPEPAGLALLSAMLGIGALRRRGG